MFQYPDNVLPPKICFVAPGAYQLLSGKEITRIVGPDLHQVLLAKELILKGLHVSIITYCQYNCSTEYIDNIEVLKIKLPKIHCPFLSIFIKSFYFWKAMKKADADIYYIRGGVPGIISLFSKIIRKKVIYSIASDAWVDKSIITENIQGFSKSILNIGILGNWLDITLANVVIVQTEYQKKLLAKNFKKNGVLIRTPFHITNIFNSKFERSHPPIITWIGSLTDVKKPEIFIEIAKKLPNYHFQLIGGYIGTNKKYSTLLRDAIKLSNFEYIGVVPFDKIEKYLKKSDILTNTSLFEGYPHAFIQAWNYQIPVVSLNVNPDEIITKYNLGFCSLTVEQMIKDIETILTDEVLHAKLGMNGKNYVIRKHDFNKILPLYLELFYNTVRL